MRIRWKLLIILLAISLMPILLMRWNGKRSMQQIGDQVGQLTKEVLIQNAGQKLLLIVEEHSRVLRRERELLEMTLRVQAAELEKRFTNAHHGDAVFNPLSSGSDGPVYRPPVKRFRVMGEGLYRPLSVSYDHQSVRLSTTRRPVKAASEGVLASMLPVYRSLATELPDLIFWQITALENGIQTIYPAPDMGAAMFDAFNHEWYRLAREKNAISWSLPSPDPFTGQFMFTVAAPLHSAADGFIGATAIAVPVSALLREDEPSQFVSETITSLLVRAEPTPEKPRVRILAREHKEEKRHHHWQAILTTEWLKTEHREMLARMVNDLESQRTGLIEMPYAGRDCLLAYGSIDAYGTALLLIVSKADITSEALLMENYVHELVAGHLKVTGIILLVVMLTVAAVAFVISRSVTRNIQTLVKATRRIAQGDFSVQSRIQSRDEMGELSRTFNQMVPALEERIKMKQALDLAMEVQQNFLPSELPRMPGLEIAGQSLYCDETGGDFYDVLNLCCREPQTVGVAVGDVSDHGIPAALLMSTTRALLRSRVAQPGTIAEVVADVNALLVEDTDKTHQFVTLFYTEINRGQQSLAWVRAGHDPALLYDPAGDRFEELADGDVSLGVEKQATFTAHHTNSLAAGQVLLIGTDGLWEARNPAGEMFGKDRFKQLIRKHHALTAETIVKTVIEAVQGFQSGNRQLDDVTLVVIKFLEID